MGLIAKFNNWITMTQSQTKDINYKQSQQFVLMDNNNIVDIVTMCSDNLQTLHLLIQAKQNCIIERIEKIQDDYIYKIHCKDKKGNYRLFSFERMYK